MDIQTSGSQLQITWRNTFSSPQDLTNDLKRAFKNILIRHLLK